MEGDGYEAALVRERVARREAEALIVELQHQVRGLRHDVQSERAKFLNEQQLRDRDVDCLNDWIEHWQARAEVDEAQVEALKAELKAQEETNDRVVNRLSKALREWLDLGDVSSGGYGGTLIERSEEALSRVSRSEPAPPNGFYSDAEHEEPVFVSTLSDHSLAEVRCDHETLRDKAFCNCGMWAGEWEPSIGQAREAWARHVWEVLNPAPPVPEEQQ